jgi:phosphoserine phosphatase RsbU/P
MTRDQKKRWITPIAYLAGGMAALALVAVLSWFDLTIPLNLRRPAVSPDGEYFAYFDQQGPPEGKTGPRPELVISKAGGETIAQYPLEPGALSWSSAGHLMVRQETQNQATLIPHVGSTFVVVTSLALSPGTEPQWAPSGTKLGFVRTGAHGPEISIYDLLQTQASAVALPAGLELHDPVLLFWSPGGQDLYFLNTENRQEVLYKCNVTSGEAQPIAMSAVEWGGLVPGLPQMSPDGTRIYLPQPLNSVIDAETGATLWTLPKDGKAIWEPWSSDGTRLYYSLQNTPGRLYAHDFAGGADSTVLSDVPSNGFFSEDDGSYFFRVRMPLAPGGYVARLREWLRGDWGWRHVDVVTGEASPIGRAELWPSESTRRGLVLMSRDDYFRVRYGLYDPNGRIFSAFRFPTDRKDVRQMLDSRRLIFLAVGLYGLLGFFVFLSRPRNSPARGLYALSLVLMLVFISLDTARSLYAAYALRGPDSAGTAIAALGWTPLLPRAFWMEDQFVLFLACLALLPPALLHFAVAFPEDNRFLAPRRLLQIPLYLIAFLPLAAILVSLTPYGASAGIRPFVSGLTFIGGGVAMGTAFLALLYNLRRPPDRRARDQVRWVLIAFVFPLLALGLLVGVNALLSHLQGRQWQYVLGLLGTATVSSLCLFTPLAIGYALLAHKLFDIRLLYLRTLRYSFLTGAVVVVYLLLVGGLSWVIAGSIGRPSTLIFVVATVLTAIILSPLRNRLESAIDRHISREHFDFSQTLQNLAEGLPNILDRQILTSVMSQTIRGALKAREFYLLVFDRRSKKLRIEEMERELPAGLADLEFDRAEPLCKYLVEQKRPFEVEVSPYDPRLIPIFQSASERLSRLHAAVVVGLVRREELVGMMALGSKTSDEFYNSEDLTLLQAVAHQAASALENAELLEEVTGGRPGGKDLELSEASPFLPGEPPLAEGCEIAGRSIAARSVGGDYYDFFELPGGKFGLSIGCVSGKGVAASVLMASLQSQLRAEAPAAKNLPALVRRINRQLFTSFRGAKYCTLFYSVFDPAARRLEFVNAAHNPPLVLGPRGIRFLASTGVPLGLFAEAIHDVRLATLEPGATLVLFSDGVIAARNPQGDPFGLDRLMASATRAAALDAAGIMERILGDVRQFTDGLPGGEDQTVVVMKVDIS